MYFKTNKLDRRHNGGLFWKYYITLPNRSFPRNEREPMNNFFQMREWAWQTWGPSKELLEWMADRTNESALCQNEHWAWQSDKYHTRLYLRTDKELSFFMLRWS